jgi:hypothetical protein
VPYLQCCLKALRQDDAQRTAQQQTRTHSTDLQQAHSKVPCRLKLLTCTGVLVSVINLPPTALACSQAQKILLSSAQSHAEKHSWQGALPSSRPAPTAPTCSQAHSKLPCRLCVAEAAQHYCQRCPSECQTPATHITGLQPGTQHSRNAEQHRVTAAQAAVCCRHHAATLNTTIVLCWLASAALTVAVRRCWLGSHLGSMPQP